MSSQPASFTPRGIVVLVALQAAALSNACGSQPVDPNENDTWVYFTHDVHGVREQTLNIRDDGSFHAYKFEYNGDEVTDPLVVNGILSEDELAQVLSMMTETDFTTYLSEANPSNACQAAAAHYRVEWHGPAALYTGCWIDRAPSSPPTNELLRVLDALTEHVLQE